MNRHITTFTNEMTDNLKGFLYIVLGGFLFLCGLLMIINGNSEGTQVFGVIFSLLGILCYLQGVYIRAKARFIAWVREGVRLELNAYSEENAKILGIECPTCKTINKITDSNCKTCNRKLKEKKNDAI